MDEFDDDDLEEERPPTRSPAEGVRIIGAEEAAAALETGQASGRRPDNQPRYGDRPPPPEGPRPQRRFPLPESVEAEDLPRPPVAPVSSSLPHWTEPPTGEVPKVIAGEGPDIDDDEDDLGVWSSLSRGPRWREHGTDWEEGEFDDASVLADDEPPLGALDTARSERSDLFSFDEPEPDDEPAPPTRRIGTRREPALGYVAAQPPRARGRRGGGGGDGLGGGIGSGRDVQAAILTGLGFGVVALICFAIGPLPTFLLATAVVVLCEVEILDVLRRAGYQPATLLAIAATVSIMVATYAKGEVAIPLVTALMVVFTFLWYLSGVQQARALVNVAVTIGAFMWVGFLGSYAALMLWATGAKAGPLGEHFGIALILCAAIATVASDVGGYFFGSQLGSRSLAPDVSPNKTVEGLVGGLITTVVVTVLLVGIAPGLHPFDGGDAFWFGLVIGVAAPIGDLCQSMIKRDLGIKDMGTLLPGHGGALDRFDGLLFALPATFYLARLIFA